MNVLLSQRTLTFFLMIWTLTVPALAQQYPYAVDTRPSGGITPTADLIAHPLDTINAVSGTLNVDIPLATLPVSNAGLTFNLSLVYDSSIYDVKPDGWVDGYVVAHALEKRTAGGWNYNFTYFVEVEERELPSYETDLCANGGDALTRAERRRAYRHRLVLPDGSRHILHLLGYGDEAPNDEYYGDGFYPVHMNGMQSYCALQSGYQNHPNQNLTWYTVDGSFLRYVRNSTTGEWTLFFPDGRRVTGSANQTDYIFDANGNYIHVYKVTESGKAVTYLEDQYTRGIRIEHDYTASATEREDKITVAGPNGPLEWRVKWQLVQIGNPAPPYTSYVCYENPGNLPPYPTFRSCQLNQSFWVVKYVQLPFAGPAFTPPPASSWATYEFTYWTGTGANRYGHLQAMRVPSGALYEYVWLRGPDWNSTYTIFDADGIAYGRYVSRKVTHDGASEEWQYAYVLSGPNARTMVTAPDGGVTTYWYNDPLPFSLGWSRGLVYKIEEPAGQVTKRRWVQNKVWGLAHPMNGAAPNNPYVSTETVTEDAVHGQPRTRIEQFFQDKNGNLLAKSQYNWALYDQNTPFEWPGEWDLLRATTMSYHVSVPGAFDTSFGTNRYWHWEAPARLNALKRQQVADFNQVIQSVTEFEYDNALANGNVRLERRWDNAKPGCTPTTPLPASCPTFERSYLPDGSGRLEHVYEPSISTHLTYDNGPLPTRVEYGMPGSAAYRRFEYDWNVGLGLVNLKTDAIKGTSVTYTYDQYNQLTLEKEGNFRQTQTLYYPDIRTVHVLRDLRSLGDGRLQTVSRADELGRVNLVRTSEGGSLTVSGDEGIKVKTAYSTFAGGTRVVQSTPYRSLTDPTLEWSCTEKDQSGRVAAVAMFKGASEPTECQSGANRTGVTTTDYHVGTGFPRLRVVDAAGKTKDSYHDALGRLSKVVEDPDGLNLATNYYYDLNDNLIQVNQGDQVRQFVYSTVNRLISVKNPETGPHWTNYSYFDSGDLYTRTENGRGITTTFAYDELHRIKLKTYSDGTPGVSYEYYPPGANPLNVGELLSIASSEASSQNNSYDALGRVTSSSHTVFGDITRNFSYAYYLNDKLESVTNPSGRVIHYTVDDAGRVARVEGGGTIYADLPAQSSPYTPDGRIAVINLGNTLWETRDFQAPGTATRFKLGTAQGANDKLELEYNFHPNANNGNLISHVIRQANQTWEQTYDYDPLNRLAVATETNGWSRTYGYDRYGNRWVSASSGLQWADPHEPVAESNFDATNNRLNVAGSDFDPSGNQSYYAPWSLAYDAENRAFVMSSASSGNVTFAYDGEGRRVRKTWTPHGGSPTTTYYLYNALGQLAAEYSTATSTVATAYVHTDMLGSTRMVTNTSGATLECYDYEPFGRMLSSADNGRSIGCHPPNPDYQINSNLPQKFTGKERDAETRLDFFGARYYSAAQGRFTSADAPFADQHRDNPQSWNLYSYVRNRPLIAVDPDGRQANWRVAPGTTTKDLENAGPELWGIVSGVGKEWVNQHLEGDTPLGSLGWIFKEFDVQKQKAISPAEKKGMEAYPDVVNAILAVTAIMGPKGGRLGKPGTRAHVGEVAAEIEARGWTIKGGGNRLPEEYIPGPGGGRSGSSYPDITATKGGKTLRLNTVDTYADGVTPTQREAINAARIRAQRPSDHLILVPKPRPIPD